MIMPERNVNFASTPTRCKPKSRINAPAIGESCARFFKRKVPTALADAPNEMNTTENPMTKETAEAKRPPRGCWPWRNCSMPMPESIEMYPGTRGSTQGERNETSPAINAAARETSVIFLWTYLPIFCGSISCWFIYVHRSFCETELVANSDRELPYRP
jgi:hypothetical protein